MLVDLDDTRLNVEERGTGDMALVVLHGGPGLDHTMFGDRLDALGDVARLLLVDQRAQGRSDPAPPGTWTLPRFAADVEALAAALSLERYVVLGHSFGAFVALQHAVDFPGRPAGTIVSSGVASETGLMAFVEANLAAFEPVDLREQVTSSWAREAHAQTPEDVRALLVDQLPFHFADPRDPRIAETAAGLQDGRFSPDVTRWAATTGYGEIDVEGRLGEVTHPVLVLAGRHDRTCSVAAAQTIAAGVPGSRLVVFEDSGHMTFIEENAAYVAAVREFLAAL
jgi:pimeloyl-ACP methyl ester carboxylesterase